MPDKVMPGPISDCDGIREAVCIHTRKIYDSCRDKDCVEDLRFYPKMQYVDVINRALSVKGGTARLLYVYVDVEPVSFNRGFYTVDMRFFYAVTLQAYLSCPAPVTVEGLCVFDKRVILFGSEGSAKVFSPGGITEVHPYTGTYHTLQIGFAYLVYLATIGAAVTSLGRHVSIAYFFNKTSIGGANEKIFFAEFAYYGHIMSFCIFKFYNITAYITD